MTTSTASELKLELDEEQQSLFAEFLTGQSMVITGPAGCGKSYFIKYLRQYCDERRINMAVTALTGCAASQVGGITLHSWAGIGLAQGTAQQLHSKVRVIPQKLQAWLQVQVLVIDEISMMDAVLFNKLHQLATIIRHNERLFGGIQLILSGDFAQLPPIGVDTKFAFQSSLWQKYLTDRTFYLQQIKRQTDPVFLDLLQAVRLGEPTQAHLKLLDSRLVTAPERVTVTRTPEQGSARTGGVPESRQSGMVSLPEAVPEQGSARTGGVPEQGSARTGGVPEQGSARTGGVPEEAVIRIEGCDEKILATRLYPTRREVQELNQRELEKLLAAQALSHSYQAHDVLHEKKGRRNLPVTPAQREMLNKCTMAPDTLILAVGAQVMLIKNLDVPAGLVNGSRGVVLGYNAQDYPLVMFDNGHELPLGPAQFETDLGKQLLVRSQIPLILAWALTIHKCQGSTLTQVVTDLTGTFAESQIYVTLSRVRSLDGLYLEGINYRMIKCHPLVKAYYAQLAHHQAPKPMPTVDPPALSADERDNPILPLLV